MISTNLKNPLKITDGDIWLLILIIQIVKEREWKYVKM